MGDFDWKNFQDLAEDLSKDVKDESKIRTAISRTYYYSYHRSEGIFLDTLGINIPPIPGKEKAGAHEKLIYALRNYHSNGNVTAFNLNRAGDFLSNLRDIRTHADYQKSCLKPKKVEIALGLTLEINEFLRNFKP